MVVVDLVERDAVAVLVNHLFFHKNTVSVSVLLLAVGPPDSGGRRAPLTSPRNPTIATGPGTISMTVDMMSELREAVVSVPCCRCR